MSRYGFLFAWCACIVPSLIDWTDFPHHMCRPITWFALPYSACTAVAHMRFNLPGGWVPIQTQNSAAYIFSADRQITWLTICFCRSLFYFPLISATNRLRNRSRFLIFSLYHIHFHIIFMGIKIGIERRMHSDGAWKFEIGIILQMVIEIGWKYK